MTWIAFEIYRPAGGVPPQFFGLLASIVGMIAGSLLPQWYGRRSHHAHAEAA